MHSLIMRLSNIKLVTTELIVDVVLNTQDADRHRGATNYNSRRSQTREPQVATSQSLPMISNRTSNSGKSSGKATTPVNKRYTNVVNATSRMLSNYFQGGQCVSHQNRSKLQNIPRQNSPEYQNKCKHV